MYIFMTLTMRLNLFVVSLFSFSGLVVNGGPVVK